jgi:hypothetical protein
MTSMEYQHFVLITIILEFRECVWMSLLVTVTVIVVLNVWDLSGSNSNMRAIELLTKQVMRRKYLLYTKNTCILKLLPSVFTAGFEALVSMNKFCVRVSEKSATSELSDVLTPSINSLLLKHCDPNQFFR